MRYSSSRLGTRIGTFFIFLFSFWCLNSLFYNSVSASAGLICSQNTYCTPGSYCNGGTCQTLQPGQCSRDSDCPSGQLCGSGGDPSGTGPSSLSTCFVGGTCAAPAPVVGTDNVGSVTPGTPPSGTVDRSCSNTSRGYCSFDCDAGSSCDASGTSCLDDSLSGGGGGGGSNVCESADPSTKNPAVMYFQNPISNPNTAGEIWQCTTDTASVTNGCYFECQNGYQCNSGNTNCEPTESVCNIHPSVCTDQGEVCIITTPGFGGGSPTYGCATPPVCGSASIEDTPTKVRGPTETLSDLCNPGLLQEPGGGGISDLGPSGYFGVGQTTYECWAGSFQGNSAPASATVTCTARRHQCLNDSDCSSGETCLPANSNGIQLCGGSTTSPCTVPTEYGGSVAHGSTISAGFWTNTACESRTLTCDNGQIKFGTVDINLATATAYYPSLQACNDDNGGGGDDDNGGGGDGSCSSASDCDPGQACFQSSTCYDVCGSFQDGTWFQYEIENGNQQLCSNPSLIRQDSINYNTSAGTVTRKCEGGSYTQNGTCSASLRPQINAECKSFGSAGTTQAPSNSSSDPLCTKPSPPSGFAGTLPNPTFQGPVGGGGASTEPRSRNCGGSAIDNPYNPTSCTAPSRGACSPNFDGREFFRDNEPGDGNNSTCANGVQQNYVDNGNSRSWQCMGSTGTEPASCSATKNEFATSGVCDGSTDGGSFYQAEISSQSLCESGTPDPASLGQATNNERSRICRKDGDGETESGGTATDSPTCTANLKEDGDCRDFGSNEYASVPETLCDATATSPNVTVNSSLGQWNWTCTGLNGGNDSHTCIANCLNGDCGDGGEDDGGDDGGNNPVCGNGICEAGESATSCPQDCENSGPTCGNNLQTEVEIGVTCNDCDGCLCGSNQILNGTVCSAVYPPDPDGPQGTADLAVTMTADKVLAQRREDLSFTITYRNLGPDTATGSLLTFWWSELFEDIESETVFTHSGDKLIFEVGNLQSGQSGTITITGKVKASFLQSDISATTQISNDITIDPNTLNNTKTIKVEVDQSLYELDFSIINPVPPINDTLSRYRMLIQRHNTDDLVFRDITPGHPWYMHIQTVVRNGIMKGYQYKFSRLFSPKKCLTRSELLIVAGRIMHMSGESDVYASDFRDTPYTDVANNLSLAKYINRAYKYGITEPFDEDLYDYNTQLHPNKDALQGEAKAVLEKLYRLMKTDTLILKPLFPQPDQCVTRGYMAYAIAHILRGNDHIVMGLNDLFLGELVTRMGPYTIADRRRIIARIIYVIDNIPAMTLYRLGLDGETLTGVLRSSLRGKVYKHNFADGGTQSFFDIITPDIYSDYVKDIYMTQYQADMTFGH